MDPARRFLGLPWRLTQFDASGEVVGDTITEYDHAPEGSVGTQGLVTRRTALVLTDALVADVYEDAPPDLASLGYFTRPGESGWWITQASYVRVDDSAGLRGATTDAAGAVTRFAFNADRTFPVTVTDPMGNVMSAAYDDRIGRPANITDSGGMTRTAVYDALARLSIEIDAGDSAQLPTLIFDYLNDQLPVVRIRQQRAESGRPVTLRSRELFDGAGRMIERRESDTVGEVAVVPNPYRGDVAYNSYNPPWEKPSGNRPWWMEQDRRLQFINLPKLCEIKVFTLAGDLVNTIRHEDPSKGYEDWNLTSHVGQAISSGIYLFTCVDLTNGKVQVGKFVVIK